ncbi:MAG TPA: hypothetical protein PK040_02030 [Anaerolineaceae bacterium]|nr:hypothetical protein [Anaerolineaceae bacterium]
MTYIEGMKRNMGYGGNEGSGLECMKISDMLPREEFHTGDRVCCPCVKRLGTGVVVEIDPDIRLARVNWAGGYFGWWYLKDLVVVGYQVEKKNRAYGRTPLRAIDLRLEITQ